MVGAERRRRNQAVKLAEGHLAAEIREPPAQGGGLGAEEVVVLSEKETAASEAAEAVR